MEIDLLKENFAWLREALGQLADRRISEVGSLRKRLDRRHVAALQMVEARERTIMCLCERNGRLRAEARASQAERTAVASCVETLEAALVKFRASGAGLSKSLLGRKSGRRQKPRSERQRGQQPGAVGHGRTQRHGLKELTEERNPPMDARVCSRCGRPYVAKGERCTTVVETQVKADTRRIVRPRWCGSRDCASSSLEVTVPPVTWLFDKTPYGISVWVCIPFERFVCKRAECEHMPALGFFVPVRNPLVGRVHWLSSRSSLMAATQRRSPRGIFASGWTSRSSARR